MLAVGIWTPVSFEFLHHSISDIFLFLSYAYRIWKPFLLVMVKNPMANGCFMLVQEMGGSTNRIPTEGSAYWYAGVSPWVGGSCQSNWCMSIDSEKTISFPWKTSTCRWRHQTACCVNMYALKNEYMNERTNERTNERMNEWMNERMNERNNEWINEWKKQWMNQWFNECTHIMRLKECTYVMYM